MKFQDAPTSYKDPFWSGIASKAEKAEGLPNGLLVSILTNGEKTDNGRVSPVGAKTPFQIMPATRDAALKKWGIDAYLSPENASIVSAKLLKDSLSRNNNDIEAAIGEYHGGTDRKNWGPVNQDYRKRVMQGVELATSSGSIDDLRALFDSATQDNQAPSPAPTQQAKQPIEQAKSSYTPQEGSVDDLRALFDEVQGGQVTTQTPEQNQTTAKKINQPKTTVEGIGGAVTRGIGLPLAGATVGAGIGSLFGGIGAVPGAAIGAGAATGAELLADPLVELSNKYLKTNLELPSQSFQNFLTRFGVPVAQSNAEKIVQSAATGAGSAVGFAGAGRAVAEAAGAARPVLRAVGETLAAGPKVQAVSGASSGAAQQYVANKGGSAGEQLAAGVAGGFATAVPSLLKAGVSSAIGKAAKPTTKPIIEPAMRATKMGGGGAIKDLAERAKPSPEILKAADNIGATALLSTAQKTANQKFKDLEAWVSSQPGSQIAQEKARNLEVLSDKAVKKLADVSGFDSPSGAEVQVRAELDNTINKLEQGINGVNQKLSELGDLSKKADDSTASKIINKEVETRGSPDGLTPAEKRFYETANRAENTSAERKQIIDAAESNVNEIRRTKLFEGADQDISSVSARVKETELQGIKAAEQAADEAFATVRQAIPEETTVSAKNILNTIEESASKRRGGMADLSGIERNIYKTLKETTDETGKTSLPTWANLDDMRKAVGAELNGTGPFRDADTGKLKQLYGALAKDTEEAALSVGQKAHDDLKAANKLIIDRKAAESSAQAVFGQKVDQGIQPRLADAMKALSNGNADKMQKLLDATPKEFHKDIIASGMNNVAPTAKDFEKLAQKIGGNAESRKVVESVYPDFFKKAKDFSTVAGQLRATAEAQAEARQMLRVQNLVDHRKELIESIKKTSDVTERTRMGKLVDALEKDINNSLSTEQARKLMNAKQKAETALETINKNKEKLFGSSLDKSLEQTMDTALKGLSNKSGVEHFANVVKSIPPSIRKEVVTSSLIKVFETQARKGQLDFNSFSKWYDGIKRSKEAYSTLNKSIGPDMAEYLESLYVVSDSIRRGSKEFIGTGRYGEFQRAYEASQGLVSNLIDLSKRGAIGGVSIGLSTAAGMPAIGAVAVGVLTALRSPKPHLMTELNKVFSGKKFQTALENASKAKTPKDVALVKNSFQNEPIVTKFANMMAKESNGKYTEASAKAAFISAIFNKDQQEKDNQE